MVQKLRSQFLVVTHRLIKAFYIFLLDVSIILYKLFTYCKHSEILIEDVTRIFLNCNCETLQVYFSVYPSITSHQ